METYIRHFAAAALGGTLGETPSGVLMIAHGAREGGDINRLRLAPPHIGEEVAVDNHIGKGYIGDGAFVAVLDTDASVGVGDDAVVEKHTVDGVHIFRSDFYSARTRGHHAVGHHDVAAGAVLLEFAAVFEADAVVAALDEAVGDAHLARMVYVDTVAVAYLQIVEQGEVADGHVVASDQMHSPVG